MIDFMTQHLKRKRQHLVWKSIKKNFEDGQQLKSRILDTAETAEIIFTRSHFEVDRQNISEEKNNIFSHICQNLSPLGKNGISASIIKFG